MEGRITCEHMDIIWAAAQLKHCSKPVHDLLPGLVKHLAASPTLHLYSLLTKLEPKDHTEQVLVDILVKCNVGINYSFNRLCILRQR